MTQNQKQAIIAKERKFQKCLKKHNFSQVIETPNHYTTVIKGYSRKGSDKIFTRKEVEDYATKKEVEI